MTQAQIQTLINQIVPNGDLTAAEMYALLTAMLNVNVTGKYTPTASTPTLNATVTMGEFMYQLTANSVVFSGTITIELGTGETETEFDFDLASAIQPTENWANMAQANVVISRVASAPTAPCVILSKTGTKLLKVIASDTTTGATLGLVVVGNFQTN